MPLDLDNIVTEYRTLRPSFERATLALREQVATSLKDAGIELYALESRTKEVESLEAKLGKNASNPYQHLADVTDLSGVCVVVYFQDDIELLVAKLRKNIGDPEAASINKFLLHEPEKFGYQAHHLTVELVRCLDSLTINDRSELAGYSGEIQIRTAFMHSWAKIEHTYNYKASVGNASIRRRFARLASLVELADQELCAIHTWFREFGASVIDRGNVNALIGEKDCQSILALLKSTIDTKLYGASELELDQCVTILRELEFQNIHDVRESLKANQLKLHQAMAAFFADDGAISSTDPLRFLAFSAALEKSGIPGLVSLVARAEFFDNDGDVLDFLERALKAFNQNQNSKE